MELPCVSIIDGRLYFNTNDEGIKELVIRGYSDFKYFCKEFFPEIFNTGFEGQRGQLADLISRVEYPYIAICSWRGIGKTSLVWAYIMHELLYQRRKFCLYIGATEDLAVRQTEDIKIELLLNDKIKEIFGIIRPDMVEEKIKFGFSRKFYYLSNPVTGYPFAVILPRGAGQAVRGSNVLLNKRKIRPDLIVIDDLETDELTRSEVQMNIIHNWFHSAVKNLTEHRKPEFDDKEGCRKWKSKEDSLYQIIVTDTLKHDSCLIGQLVEDPEWKSLILKLAEEDENGVYHSCVPELFTDEQIQRDIEIEKSKGTFDIYSREMLCKTNTNEEMNFETKDFRYYSGDEHLSKFVNRFIVIDPARSISSSSSHTGALCFGVNTFENKIYIYDYILKKISINELEHVIVNKVKEHNLNCICVEDIGLKDWIRSWLENIIGMHSLNTHILWLSSNKIKNRSFFSSSKIARVSTALPLYKSGQVYHHNSIKDSILERQLLNFPKNTIWDLLDCIGYIPYIMENEGLYFMPANMYNTKEIEQYDKKFKEGIWRIV